MPPVPGRSRRARRAALLVAAGVVLVVGLVVGAVVVGTGTGRPARPEERLAAVQDAVAEATSYRLTITDERHVAYGDDANGSETTTRHTAEGSWDGDTWHARVEADGGAAESIVHGDEYYERHAPGVDRLDDERWLFREDWVLTDEAIVGATGRDGSLLVFDEPVEPVDDELEDEAAVSMATRLHLGYTGGPSSGLASAGGLGLGPTVVGLEIPTQILDAIGQIEEPTVVELDDEVVTLAGTLPIAEDLVDDYGGPLPDAAVELEVDADDLPTALRLRIEQGTSWARVDIRFAEWNQSVRIAPPAEGEIERTPWLDEEGLRDLETLALVWPTTPPEGWELSVWSPAEVDELGYGDSGCETVELGWDTPPPDIVDVDDAFEYLWLTLQPADCALDEDATAFTPGGPGGWPSRAADPGMVEVLVDETVVLVDTSLPEAERDALLASLAPVDVETVIEAASEPPSGW